MLQSTKKTIDTLPKIEKDPNIKNCSYFAQYHCIVLDFWDESSIGILQFDYNAMFHLHLIYSLYPKIGQEIIRSFLFSLDI